jgi:murein L,D-transpeptidase YcbB/YkuD
MNSRRASAGNKIQEGRRPLRDPSGRRPGWRREAAFAMVRPLRPHAGNEIEDFLGRKGPMLCLSRLLRFPFQLVMLVVAVVAEPSVSNAKTAPPPATAHDDSVATILREATRLGTLAGLRWPHFTNAQPAVDSLYTRSGWRPVWTSRGRPTSGARAAIDILLDAETRGLHADDYDAPALEQRARAFSSARSASAGEVAWFDLALSVGLLRHVDDVRVGRVDPRTLSIGINVAPKRVDLVRLLRVAAEHRDVGRLVREAEPPFVQYRELKSAYARYRELAARTDLPNVAIKKTVRPGDRFPDAASLRRRLVAVGDLAAGDAARATGSADSTRYDTLTVAAVKRFQDRHGLSPDGVLGPGTLAAVNVPMSHRVRQLELAMERIRWLPEIQHQPFIVVNVPGFRLHAFDSLNTKGTPAFTMNVVVGSNKVGRQTPLFERDMRYVVLRPYWVIPRSILEAEVLPSVRKDPSYLEQHQYEIYSGSGDYGPAVPSTEENLERVARGELGMRQQPGPKNSLGLAKFIFPNDQNVFLHGTPATELFSRARRDFSHGCIRVEDPPRLAVWVLRDPKKWSAAEVEKAMDGASPLKANLAKPLPVIICYSTAVVRADGRIAFYDDVYHHDAELEQALAKGYPYGR